MKTLSWIGITVLIAIWFASPASAQNTFVYVNNAIRYYAGSNSVSAFSFSNGVLTEVPGSPFSTGHPSDVGYDVANRIVIVGRFLYATNDYDGTVSGFLIDPEKGGLTPLPGSPYGGSDAWYVGLTLGATRDGKFLFVGDRWGWLHSYQIGSDGALTEAPGSPIAAGGLDGMTTSPDGKWLLEANPNGGVEVFGVSENGALTPVPGSPFSLTWPSSVDVNCASNLAFVSSAVADSVTVGVFNIAADGGLVPHPDSPFVELRSQHGELPLLSPDGKFLFVGAPHGLEGDIAVFAVAADGALTPLPGSPYSTGAMDFGTAFPDSMATDRAGRFLFVSGWNRMSIFSIAADGALTLLPGYPRATTPYGDPISPAGFPSAVAVYPARTCNQPPLANAGADQQAIAGETVNFDGSAASDPDGTIVAFQWDFGDNASGAGVQTSHAYALPGNYTVTLLVTDNGGAAASDTAQITVLSTSEAIGALSQLVAGYNLRQGIANSLDAKLQNALAALSAANAGQRQDAANKLMAFINAAAAQRGQELTSAQAEQLIGYAQRILSVI